MIIPYADITPTVDETVFVAHGAVILGDVHIGKDSSVWFNVVIRGDVHQIRIGERTNVQDLSMLHVTCNKHALTIGNGVTIGHCVMLHGCTVEDYALIGMNATVLDGAAIGHHSMVAAGAVVREGSLYHRVRSWPVCLPRSSENYRMPNVRSLNKVLRTISITWHRIEPIRM